MLNARRQRGFLPRRRSERYGETADAPVRPVKKPSSRTFLLHPQLDVPGDQNGGRKEVELESAKNVALVDAAVIEGDVEDPDGQVLQVLAPVPQQTAFKRSVHLGTVVILEPVYLRRRRRA